MHWGAVEAEGSRCVFKIGFEDHEGEAPLA
jgi:hypothetical protein